jgi:hypothetical protein
MLEKKSRKENRIEKKKEIKTMNEKRKRDGVRLPVTADLVGVTRRNHERPSICTHPWPSPPDVGSDALAEPFKPSWLTRAPSQQQQPHEAAGFRWL